MAIQVVRQRVCDVCKTEDIKGTYRVTRSGQGGRNVDLCAEHAEYLEGLLGVPKRKRGGQPKKREVLTQEEVKARRIKGRK